MTTDLTRRELITLAASLALPWDAVAAVVGAAPVPAPATSPGPPDLANLYEMMAWLGRENAPRLSFLDERWKSLPDWKAEARPVYLRHLGYQPEARALGADLVDRETREGFTVESVRIHATSAYDIPAKVLVPSSRKGRLPGVVALHCHSGQYVWGHEKVLSSPKDSAPLCEFRDRAYGRAYGEMLAAKGYVVLVIDAFYFGARRLRVEDLDTSTAPADVRTALESLPSLEPGGAAWLAAVNRACGRYEELTAKTLFTVGVNWPGMLAWDDMRSVDYLCSRPEVDPERIGCVGLSLGGLRAVRLIGADPRVKAACVAGWMTELPEQVRNHIRYHTWMLYVPGLASWLDLPDVAALTAPGALLVQQCARDRMYPMAAMKSSIEKLTKIYGKAGIAERFRGTFHDEPHSFHPAMQDEAAAWLERWV